MTTENSVAGDPKGPNVPELDTPDRKLRYQGIPTTEEEEKEKNIKNVWFYHQVRSEAFD